MILFPAAHVRLSKLKYSVTARCFSLMIGSCSWGGGGGSPEISTDKLNNEEMHQMISSQSSSAGQHKEPV